MVSVNSALPPSTMMSPGSNTRGERVDHRIGALARLHHDDRGTGLRERRGELVDSSRTRRTRPRGVRVDQRVGLRGLRLKTATVLPSRLARLRARFDPITASPTTPMLAAAAAIRHGGLLGCVFRERWVRASRAGDSSGRRQVRLRLTLADGRLRQESCVDRCEPRVLRSRDSCALIPLQPLREALSIGCRWAGRNVVARHRAARTEDWQSVAISPNVCLHLVSKAPSSTDSSGLPMNVNTEKWSEIVVMSSQRAAWNLSGFGDEIDPDPRVQIAVLQGARRPPHRGAQRLGRECRRPRRRTARLAHGPPPGAGDDGVGRRIADRQGRRRRSMPISRSRAFVASSASPTRSVPRNIRVFSFFRCDGRCGREHPRRRARAHAAPRRRSRACRRDVCCTRTRRTSTATPPSGCSTSSSRSARLRCVWRGTARTSCRWASPAPTTTGYAHVAAPPRLPAGEGRAGCDRRGGPRRPGRRAGARRRSRRFATTATRASRRSSRTSRPRTNSAASRDRPRSATPPEPSRDSSRRSASPPS